MQQYKRPILQISFIISFLCIAFLLNAQEEGRLYGTVVNENDEPLFGATLNWEGTIIAAVADENGNFDIEHTKEPANLIINYVGYNTVSIPFEPHENDVRLVIEGVLDLMEVEVAADIRDNYVSTLETRNVETIGGGELRKAPCCNLAESFSTNASVDVTYTDAITGSREIQMLGLRGTYTQLMTEKRPSLGGLGSGFLMEYIPGTWVESIQISKGASTVQNGYQAITGQINTELIKPFNEDRELFVNLYGSTFGRYEANVHLNKQWSDQWSSSLLLHANQRKNTLDGNNDGFYDTPQKEMMTGLFRTFYRGPFVRAQINLHGVTDRHTAGQILPENANPIDYYTIAQANDRIELFGKIGYLGFENENNTIGFIYNMSWHKVNALYGNRIHQGEEQNAYANLMYSTILGDKVHKLDLGASYLYDDYVEFFEERDFGRLESVPGAFVEYSYAPDQTNLAAASFKEKFGLIAGLRVDQHNLFGTLITPRLNVKYNFNEDIVIRLSGGRGYRTANVIAENIGLLASQREIIVEEDLNMEDAWNVGLNYTQNFQLGEREGSFAFDLYRTDFNNQIIRDREADTQTIRYYNLNGKSYANSLLAVLSYELIDGLEAKVAYKLNDVKMTFNHGFHDMPLFAKHRGLVTLDYTSPNEKWMFNTSMQLVGKQRFPYNYTLPEELRATHTGDISPYALLGAQVTRSWNRFEVYAGGENLTNYTQENPILDWQNPFGEYFDATQIYAPITGAMGYVGIRFWVE